MKILVTGFEPFGGAVINPAYKYHGGNQTYL